MCFWLLRVKYVLFNGENSEVGIVFFFFYLHLIRQNLIHFFLDLPAQVAANSYILS